MAALSLLRASACAPPLRRASACASPLRRAAACALPRRGSVSDLPFGQYLLKKPFFTSAFRSSTGRIPPRPFPDVHVQAWLSLYMDHAKTLLEQRGFELQTGHLKMAYDILKKHSQEIGYCVTIIAYLYSLMKSKEQRTAEMRQEISKKMRSASYRESCRSEILIHDAKAAAGVKKSTKIQESAASSAGRGASADQVKAAK